MELNENSKLDIVNPDEEQLTETEETVTGEVVYGEVIGYEGKYYKVDVKKIAGKLLQLFNFAEIIKDIEADKEYEVIIPQKLREALKNGDKWLMKDKENPDLLRPMIIGKAKDGKKQVVKQLELREKEILKGNPARDLAQQCQMMYLQGQVQDVARLLEEAIEEIKLIEDTQDAEKAGLLASGKEQLLLAFNQSDEDARIIAVQNAIATISEAKGQTVEVLKDRCDKFEAIPESKILQFLKVMVSPKTDYLSRNAQKIQKMQKYLNLISDAARIMSTAYLMTGETRNAELVYESTIEQLKALDAEKLATALYIPDRYLPKENLELPYDLAGIFEETGRLIAGRYYDWKTRYKGF